MKKVSTSYIIEQYQSGVPNYKKSTLEVGLWDSEKYVFTQYLQKSDKILDMGCGTGRTTFPLYATGYQNVKGLDLTPEMIEAAQELNAHFGVDIPFEVADARELDFEEGAFDAVIFSFNGLMSIPDMKEREKALKEIARVLKRGGVFIFTTHDRENDPLYFDFWKEEEKKWAEGEQRTDLYEFGDIISFSKNEIGRIFIHIPIQSEVEDFVQKAGFEVVETFYRPDKFDEPQKVKDKSGECRFWVVRKK
ncbi:MAG: class I SAM-dependent methyltransferase [Chitinophagales bacterium]